MEATACVIQTSSGSFNSLAPIYCCPKWMTRKALVYHYVHMSERYGGVTYWNQFVFFNMFRIRLISGGSRRGLV